jgi:hypothetical protein
MTFTFTLLYNKIIRNTILEHSFDIKASERTQQNVLIAEKTETIQASNAGEMRGTAQ